MARGFSSPLFPVTILSHHAVTAFSLLYSFAAAPQMEFAVDQLVTAMRLPLQNRVMG